MNTHNLFIIILLLLAHTVKAQQQEWAVQSITNSIRPMER